MITKIGIAAGDIWHYLDDNGEASLEQIANAINTPRDLVLMSVGWLAREGHVSLKNSGKDFIASLNTARQK